MSRQIAETERWIWPFELLELIGHGGMGEVYRARTVNTKREVALKLLPTDMASNKTVVERFKREMTVLKNLKHPNIVTCYGGTCKGNRYYYAMELVTGGSLERLIRKRERLSWKQAAGFMLKLCAALECAHEQGIVHRDIKPANLLLTRKGQLKLADFGLAYVTAETKLTAAGMAMGTYYYMSPEQIRGTGTIDCRTDLYAVGCVLFEMLTGRPPFTGETPAEVLNQHLTKEPPSVSQFGADLPDPAFVDMLIRSLMEKSPAKRPASAATIAQWIDRDVPSKNSTGTTASKGQSAFAKREATRANWARLKRAWNLRVVGVLLLLMFIGNIALLYDRYAGHAGDSQHRSDILWVEALRNDNVAVRDEAVRSLSQIGQENPLVIDAVVDCLADARPTVRKTAVRVLGELGETARPLTARLMKILRTDDDRDVRLAAEQALSKIRGTATTPSF